MREELMAAPFVALTDHRWFEYLRSKADDRGRLDEANFWLPSAQRPTAKFAAGDPFFFRLKSPDKAIVGFGFFASFCRLPLRDAWLTFGDRNGDPTREAFEERILGYRMRDMSREGAETRPLGCIALIHLSLWNDSAWIPWGEARGWKPSIQQGRYEEDPRNVEILESAMRAEAVPLEEMTDRFRLVDSDERTITVAPTVRREGQGSFRARLLDVYSGSCAITGEHTEPVLAAAHIQPYLGPRSNHVQNGLLLTQEFHTLFDLGYVAVTPDFNVRVSPRLQKDFGNGKRYAIFNDKKIVNLPSDPRCRPSEEALDWHYRKMFKAG